MASQPPSEPPPSPPSKLSPPVTTFLAPSSRPSTRDGLSPTPTPAAAAPWSSTSYSSHSSHSQAISGGGSGVGGFGGGDSRHPPPPATLTQSFSAPFIAFPSSNPPPPPATAPNGHLPPPSSASTNTRDRKPSFSRKSASFSAPRRRGNSVATASTTSTTNANANAVVTDAAAPPALPGYALGSAAKIGLPLTISTSTPTMAPSSQSSGGKDPRERDFDTIRSPTSEDSFGRMLSRTTTSGSVAQMPPLPPPTPVGGVSGNGTFWQPGDASNIYQHIVDLANKRISTFDYLRKVHQGRVHWFNAYLFDRPDLSRMPSLDPRKLSRKATNYLLLGLSLPVIIDLYSTSPLDFLRSLSSLLSEFDSFQQLRNDSSTSASLARARLPNMFRRPGGRGRRSTSAADSMGKEATDAMNAANGGAGGASGPGGGANGANMSASVRNFAASEADMLPGEEYTFLLTPALPFEPDYFETFATLCDVFIETYSKFLSLLTSPRDCNASVAELFTKADARVRKIILQNIAKEFEDSSRANIKSEMAGIGKVVLSGLM